MIGGLAPDIDVLISWLPALIFQLFILQHRGLFHTVLVAPVIAMGIILSTQYFERFNPIERLKEPLQEQATELNSKTIFWGSIGTLLHLFMDYITQGGLYLFYPFINERITSGTISVFDPLVTVLSGIAVIRLFYSKVTRANTYTFSRFQKSAKSLSILFVLLLSGYTLLQINTMITHSPSSTTPNSIPLFRWVVWEENNIISIASVNQLTQQIDKIYSYSPLTYNQTEWNRITIESVVKQAKGTLQYQKFKFQVGSESRLAINATFNEKENRWEISFLDTLQDAQNQFYGIPEWFSIDTETTILLN
ncbi:MAG: metal-dependent hydrolase [Candidatus Heimdallarchaeota archaeon]|nr:MAG: metal-dependent hydrolase [Candidatus Heimdallarchaeota archaeon]